LRPQARGRGDRRWEPSRSLDEAHDLPVVQGVVVVSAFVVLAVNLVLEFAVALLNPKARSNTLPPAISAPFS